MKAIVEPERAFPIPSDWAGQGMTLRDWFAGQALMGWTSDPTRGPSIGVDSNAKLAARTAYSYADAMIAEKRKWLRNRSKK